MNLQAAKDLIDFNYWGRDRVLAAVEDLPLAKFTGTMGGSFRSIRDTLVHTYFAEWLWLRRWKGLPLETISPEGFPDVATLRKAWLENEAALRAYFSEIDEAALQTPMAYKTMAGEATSSTLWQMLQHVVNHGTYHRGQVTTLLRQIDAAPPKAMDLILFYRERGR